MVDVRTVEINANKLCQFNWSTLVRIAVIGVGGLIYWKVIKDCMQVESI